MVKFRSIRSRLTATFLGTILVVMVIIGFFLYNLLERYYLSHFQESLLRTANLAAEFVAGHLRDQPDPVRLSGLAATFSRQDRALRVIFVNRDGDVVGDSVRIGGLLGQNLQRDEIKAAFDSGVGSSIQISPKTHQKVMQIAVPVEENGEPVGAVFLSASLQDIYLTLEDIQKFLMLATLLAISVGGGGSIILARRFTGPIELLTSAATEIAEGKLEQQIEVNSQDEIGRLAERFNLMASRLNHITGNLKNFAANVSHELRTPLASLSLLVQSVKDYEMEPEQRQEFLEDMDRELNRLIKLVNDLLELTKFEHLREIKREQFCLAQLAEEVIEQIQPRFKRQDLRLIADLPPGGPFVMYGSPFQIRQLFHNILDNALKYTSPGGWVRVSLKGESSLLQVNFEDTGCGIPAADLPYIFERFYRVDPARSREMGGTGLGLAIAREIVEAHGGTIRAESVPGHGSSFLVTLPRGPGTTPAASC